MKEMKESSIGSWKVAKIKDIQIPVDKVSNKERLYGGKFTYFDIDSIDNSRFRITNPKSYRWQDAPSRAQQIVKKGDILFSTVRTYLKNIATIEEDYESPIASTGFCVVRPSDEMNNKYLFYYMLTREFLEPLNELQRGSSYPAVRNKDVYEQVISYPSLLEQQSIVQKIEELFSELDHVEEQLQKVKRQLSTYKQSILQHAFLGYYSVGTSDWTNHLLGNISEIKRGKSKHRPRDDEKLYGGKYPFIQTGDIRAANGKVINRFRQTYSELGLQQSKLWPKGTLCITIAANIGDTAFLGFDACFPDSVVGIIANEEIALPEFINYYLMFCKSNLERLAPATAQKNINVDILEKVEILVPSLAVQRSIVNTIESKVTNCDHLVESFDNEVVRLKTLRQSILHKAFTGQLITSNKAVEAIIV